MFKIEEELKKIPGKPGVYIMRDKDRRILYIGKARLLSSRVKQYFQDNVKYSPKTQALVSKIYSFDYIVSDSESEALILERNMVHSEKPPYNILLKDDKSFPYIKITVNEKYPRVFLTRKLLNDGGRYFGPYTDYPSAKETVVLINKIFPLKRCKKKFENGYGNKRPCLNYYIDQCLGPCQGNIDKKDYESVIEEIIGFINGRREDLQKEFREKMYKASENKDFEKAAVYRDRIKAIEHTTTKHKVFNMTSDDSDIIGISTDGITAVVNVFIIRKGITIGREFFTLNNIKEDTEDRIISSFLSQYYELIHFVPKNIMLQRRPEDLDILKKWLEEKKGAVVNFRIPVRGEKLEYVKLAAKNAEHELMRINAARSHMNIKTQKTLEEIKKELKLQRIPERIEAFDISNNRNRETVASMVVYRNGRPYKNDYRRYRINTTGMQNDYASMSEVISRRYKNNGTGRGEELAIPDIILVDGGRGHVSTVSEVIEFLDLKIPVFGMVKDDRHKSRGLVTLQGEVDLTKNLILYRFITGIQSEAHRFAIDYNKKLREKGLKKSELDNINGIGEARKRALIKKFKSIDSIKKASIEELMEVKEINEKLAKEIYIYFK